MVTHNIASLRLFWSHLSALRKKQFWLIFILMIVASLSEAVSIGAILPFLGALIEPDQIYQHTLAQPIIRIFNINSPEQLIFPLTIVFICAALIAGLVRLILLYVITRFEQAVGADLSIRIYRLTLYQDYSTHISQNSSDIINSITGKTNIVVMGVLAPTLALTSSIIILIGIMSILLAINIEIALISFGIFGFIYWGISLYTRQRLLKNSQCISIESTKIIKSLQEGLGGIRDVLIDGSQNFYCKLYGSADLPLRRASANNSFINSAPRFLIEALGMTLIAGLAYAMSQQADGLVTTIPVLGVLAMGAQRLLPTLQLVYRSIGSMRGSYASFQDILELLNQPLPDHVHKFPVIPITFNKKISINNLSFRYSVDSPWILENVNLNIDKGKCIGFVGETGSGKSTLLDIIMGLLTPTRGTLMVDEKVVTIENCRNWQAHVAHVPQNIYLSDTTIEENIAFGQSTDQIDHDRVRWASHQARISELIESWPKQYQTFVGERGVRLSGGQRQRIGIARALYRKANVLILDEATSALDNKTEKEVMKAIEGLEGKLTVLIIAHRITTLKKCDQIIELNSNMSFRLRKYEDLVREFSIENNVDF